MLHEDDVGAYSMNHSIIYVFVFARCAQRQATKGYFYHPGTWGS